MGQYYQERFGKKTYRLALSMGGSCPNRDSAIGACSFCDEWGSAGFYVRPQLSIATQIEQYKTGLIRRFKPEAYLAYFQPYTNSFGRTEALAPLLEEALAAPEVIGLILGTRPDCLSSSLFPLLEGFIAAGAYVSIELGIQSFDEQALKFLNRGHGAAACLEGLKKVAAHPKIDLGVHLMFGLPGETDQKLIETAHRLNDSGVSLVKLHQLHVLKNTPLEALYLKGEYQPLELDEYARKVTLFLEQLDPKIALGRLAANASHVEELVAPLWSGEKMRPINHIEKYLERHSARQGRLVA
ncbi:MAG: TIGR01212 family radical SAM protein [Candidatus Lambdaproteobacteria bacterium RIFOXYD2_FULL_50_16]|uniref:TIGR01212 family radical SAM protein n=1 Tax=Candidatus Lambdaproteobacteria bacterium RIFOXYD2_FULL_50_16 TaxID=1817772 RepID=A0A1F6GE00_9PROT|nr:MAG: TIGR01212 family radical SAM protein [Candidatus Lambdaproteobacteria bacterium RIFOXYD2_FULL_50_16]